MRGPEPGSPALVVLQPRHKRSWDSEDQAFHEEQAALPAQARQRVMQPRLLGLWEGIDVDPRVWGMGGDSSLLQLSVQMVRQAPEGQHRRGAAAAAPDVEGVGEHGAVWPAIWRREAHQRGLLGHGAGPGGEVFLLKKIQGATRTGGVFVELVTQWSSDPTEINFTAMRHVVKR